MSQGNSVFWNMHERITSADLNLMATMAATLSLQGEKGALISPDTSGSFAAGALAMGFLPAIDGSNPDTVLVDPRGALWMTSASTPSIPSGDVGNESLFRFASTLELPTPVTPLSFSFAVDAQARWFIVEARVIQAPDTFGTRDIRNQVDKKFYPQNVVVAQHVAVEFRATRAAALGAADFPAATSGWVPIAAVQTQPGGGLITADRIVDLRLTPKHVADEVSVPIDAIYRRGRFDFTLESDGTFVGQTIEPMLVRGVRVAPTLGISTAAANISAIIPSPTNDTTYYLYAVAPGRLPTALRSDLGDRGIIVASTIAPDLQGAYPVSLGRSGGAWVNPSLIPQSAVPSPYKTIQAGVVAGSAVCIGSVHRRTGAWVAQSQTNHRVIVNGQALALQQVAAPLNATAFTPTFAMLPVMTRTHRAWLDFGTGGISTFAGIINVVMTKLGANQTRYLSVVNPGAGGGGSGTARASMLVEDLGMGPMNLTLTQDPVPVNPSYGAMIAYLDSYEW